MTTDPVDNRDMVEVLADDFMSRKRRGESPTVEEYAVRCPERAAEIREVFPAIAAMEKWKPQPLSPRPMPGFAFPPRGWLGDCRLIREIGRGGMGVVYEAEQESLGRRVAVKVLPYAPWADDRPMRRFLREAKTTANLRHGNIVPVFTVGQEGDLHYYVMPLIAGVGLDLVLQELRRRQSIDGDFTPVDSAGRLARTLWDGSFAEESPATRADGDPPAPVPVVKPRVVAHVSPGGRDPRYWNCVAQIGRQAALALHHAHEQGVLHRDVKPANLLLDEDGVVWVADFGLAKALKDDDLSRTGDFIGTPRYMPPERFHGQSDARGDVYSLGLTLYELLTLRPVFEALDRGEIMRLLIDPRPPKPREVDSAIPLDLETVVLKAIDPEPDRRYDSAAGLADDLARFLEGLPVQARRETRRERLRRWVRQNRTVARLAAICTVLGIIAAYFFMLWVFAPPPPMGPDGRPQFRARPAFPPPPGPRR